MIINLTKLVTNLSNKIQFDEYIELDKNYLKNTDIKDISKIHVVGNIRKLESNFELDMNIKCTLTLLCSISLKDVYYDIDIDVNDIIGESLDNEEIEENNKIINNSIDLIPIIWQNIILEVPLKVISPDIKVENLQGDGWKFITEEKVDNKDIDPRLEKLKDFLNE